MWLCTKAIKSWKKKIRNKAVCSSVTGIWCDCKRGNAWECYINTVWCKKGQHMTLNDAGILNSLSVLLCPILPSLGTATLSLSRSFSLSPPLPVLSLCLWSVCWHFPWQATAYLGSPGTASVQIWLLWLFQCSSHISLRNSRTVPDVVHVLCFPWARQGGFVPAGGTPRKGWSNGIGACLSPWERGDPLSLLQARGCRTCLCTGSSAAWESRQLWLQVQKFSWVWQNAFPVFLEIWASLWGWGRWETTVSEGDLSGSRRHFHVGFIELCVVCDGERNQDFLSWVQDEIPFD